jgi:hypothetical protein
LEHRRPLAEDDASSNPQDCAENNLLGECDSQLADRAVRASCVSDSGIVSKVTSHEQADADLLRSPERCSGIVSVIIPEEPSILSTFIRDNTKRESRSEERLSL